MGGCLSKGDESGRLHSEEIERRLDEDSKRLKRECKILLLGQFIPFSNQSTSLFPPGSGESGKSTVVKQMKIIHQGGFTTDQLLEYRPIVYRNVAECARSVVIYMRKIGVECQETTNRVSFFLIYPLPLLIPSSSSSSRRSSTTIQRHTADPKSISLQKSRKPYTSSSRTPSSQRSSRII